VYWLPAMFWQHTRVMAIQASTGSVCAVSAVRSIVAIDDSTDRDDSTDDTGAGGDGDTIAFVSRRSALIQRPRRGIHIFPAFPPSVVMITTLVRCLADARQWRGNFRAASDVDSSRLDPPSTAPAPERVAGSGSMHHHTQLRSSTIIVTEEVINECIHE
jgi:hypothetical protein